MIPPMFQMGWLAGKPTQRTRGLEVSRYLHLGTSKKKWIRYLQPPTKKEELLVAADPGWSYKSRCLNCCVYIYIYLNTCIYIYIVVQGEVQGTD